MLHSHKRYARAGLLVVAAVSVAGRPHYLHHRACIAQFCMRVAACALLSWPAWYVQAPDAAHKDIRRRARFNTPVFRKWHKSADNHAWARAQFLNSVTVPMWSV